ncbi:MAG: SET domain-containing protein-lysine N-methyltransferase [Chlamydiia bacterium]
MVETTRNFLVPDDLEELLKEFNVTFLDHLKYSEGVDLEWIRRKAAKKLLDPKFHAFNQWNRALFHRELGGIRQKMGIKFIDELKGYGLFAEQVIPEMTCVGEYTGIVKKRDRKTDRDNSYIFEYAIDTFDTGYVIDAESTGNHTRFINHSDEPNLLSRWLLIDNLPRIIFFTKRRIEVGEELEVDYGPYYWE